MTEGERIADQLHRAIDGPAWHGDSVFEILRGVTARQAAARPIPNAHSIWGLVLHMIAWGWVVKNRVEGKRQDVPDEGDWPQVTDTGEEAWRQAQEKLKSMVSAVCQTATGLDNARLAAFAPGCAFDNYVMLHGLVQHCLYHAGQMALLKKLVS